MLYGLSLPVYEQGHLSISAGTFTSFKQVLIFDAQTLAVRSTRH